MENSSQNPKDNNITKMKMVNLAMELGFIIALPIVSLGLLGKWLDQRLHTDPWLTLAGIILAIVATTAWMTKKMKELMK